MHTHTHTYIQTKLEPYGTLTYYDPATQIEKDKLDLFDITISSNASIAAASMNTGPNTLLPGNHVGYDVTGKHEDTGTSKTLSMVFDEKTSKEFLVALYRASHKVD